MAENQTTEDSGQQSQNHHLHNQQQLQQQEYQQNSVSSQQDPPSPSPSVSGSPITMPQENNSASSSSEDTQTVDTPNSHLHAYRANDNTNHNQPEHNHQQGHSLNIMDHPQFTDKFKNTAVRRNTIQSHIPMRGASTTSAKKPPLTKITSLTNASGGVVSGIKSKNSSDKNHYYQNQPHHHPHYQHHVNSATASQHHHSTSISGGSDGGCSVSGSAVNRRTSESLRLHASSSGTGGDIGSNGGISGTSSKSSTPQLSNTTSNSSLQLNINTNNSSSSSTSVAPQSTDSSTTSLSTKVTSLNSKDDDIGEARTTTGRTHYNQGHGDDSGSGTCTEADVYSRKPKPVSSFHITSVTMSQQAKKLNYDNGDESADDLDEFHTTETPSKSDESFSKEDVYFSNTALSATAPVIPTSSQYGLVVVDPTGSSLEQTVQNVQVNVADNIINVVSAEVVSADGSKKKDDTKETQPRSERFKVVKIESTEPFRRGRWMCMDYLDHSTVGTVGKEGSGGNNSNEKTVSSEPGTTGGNGAGGGTNEPIKTTQSMIIGTGTTQLLENYVDGVASSLHLTTGEACASSNGAGSPAPQFQPQTSAPPGISTAPATVVHGLKQMLSEASAPNMQQGQQQQQHHQQQLQPEPQQLPQVYGDNTNSNSAGGGSAGSTQEIVHGQTLPLDYATVAAQKLRESLELLKKQEEAIAASEEAGTVYVPPPQLQQPLPRQQQLPQTLPGNLQFQNGGITVTGGNSSAANMTQIEPTQQAMATLQSQQQLSQQMPTAYIPQQQQQQSQQQQNFQQQQPPQTSLPQMLPSGNALGIQPPPHQLSQLQQQQHSISAPATQIDGMLPHQPPTMQQLQQQSQLQPLKQQLQPQLQPAHPPAYQHQNSAPTGHTMPLLAQMTNYELQQQASGQQQQPPPPHQKHLQQSAPPTITDPNVFAAAIQVHQQQQIQHQQHHMQQLQQPQHQQQQQQFPQQKPLQQQQHNPVANDTVQLNNPTTVANLHNEAMQLQQQHQQMQQLQKQQQHLQQQQQQILKANNLNIATSVSNSNSNNVVATNMPIAGEEQVQSQVQVVAQQQPAQLLQQQVLQQQTPQTQATTETETESASGTSAVAIDNKIEQAMDLVKSHLMIAVREEVEVLKEKISELMDKINQLEVENTILKANISQETLQQLQMQTQLQIGGGNSTTFNANCSTVVATTAITTAVATNATGAIAITAAPQLQQQQPQQVGTPTTAPSSKESFDTSPATEVATVISASPANDSSENTATSTNGPSS